MYHIEAKLAVFIVLFKTATAFLEINKTMKLTKSLSTLHTEFRLVMGVHCNHRSQISARLSVLQVSFVCFF